jgi:hypothetical protein
VVDSEGEVTNAIMTHHPVVQEVGDMAVEEGVDTRTAIQNDLAIRRSVRAWRYQVKYVTISYYSFMLGFVTQNYPVGMVGVCPIPACVLAPVPIASL